MNVTCPTCNLGYDDAERSTICPHPELSWAMTVTADGVTRVARNRAEQDLLLAQSHAGAPLTAGVDELTYLAERDACIRAEHGDEAADHLLALLAEVDEKVSGR